MKLDYSDCQFCLITVFSYHTDETETSWQLRRLRHYIALKEDMNPEYLCPPSTLIKLRLGIKPVVEKEFFQYPLALQKALRGEDGVRVLETEYSDLSIPFPYTPPSIQELFFCCKHWALTDHLSKDCKLTKAEIKDIKKKHYQDNPDKKAARNRMVHQKERSTIEKRKRRNKRNAESKKRNLPEAFMQRRQKWYERRQQVKKKYQKTTAEIQELQVSRGIMIGNRNKQYAMLIRQKYREKVDAFVYQLHLN